MITLELFSHFRYYINCFTTFPNLFYIVIFLQDSSHFYLLMSSKAGSGQGNWQIKRVESLTGTADGQMYTAITKPESVAGQTELLWRSSNTNGNFKKFYI